MLEALLNDGWAYHATESARFADELEAAAAAGVDPALLVQFLKVSTHTIGEHLGNWPRALRLGERVLAGRAPDAASARAWAHLWVARTLAGDPVAAVEAELAHAFRLAGDGERSAEELAISDAAAADWKAPGLRSWYAEARARAVGR
jgi:hypothetical protein